MKSSFKNKKQDNIVIEEDEEDFKKVNKCRLSEKSINSKKVRVHCHLTNQYKGPAHETCFKNVKRVQSNFILIIFHSFSNYVCHLFFKKLVDKKKDEVKLDTTPKTKEGNMYQ